MADPLVDQGFRDRWFGWLDPGRVLVDYAKRRAAGEWTLVAAATSYSTADVFRDSGIPHALCTLEMVDSRGEWPGAVLDEMHLHRLQLEYPDLFDRLVRLADAHPSLQEQVIVPVAGRLIDAVQQRDDYPAALGGLWTRLMATGDVDSETWRRFVKMARFFWLGDVGVKRPGLHDVSPDEVVSNELYRRYWLVGRALEAVMGWAARPLPLAEMVYAAAAVRTVDIRELVAPALARVEAEIARE